VVDRALIGRCCMDGTVVHAPMGSAAAEAVAGNGP